MQTAVRNQLRYILWVTLCTLWIAVTAVVPDFADNPIDDFRTGFSVVCYVLACSGVSFLLFYAVGISRRVCAVFLPIYGLLGAAVSYYRICYKVTVTPVIVECMFNTNPETVRGVVSWQLLLWIICNLCLSVVFLVWRWKRISPLSHAPWQAVVSVLCLSIYCVSPMLHRSLSQRFPLNIVHSLREYSVVQAKRHTPRTIPEILSVTENGMQTDSLDIVVVIGESVRADHLQLNGYARKTNPCLSQRKNVVSLPHIRTLYTHTAASVPVLLTRADSLNPDYQYTETSFVSVFKQAGFYAAWLTNQDMNETFATFPAECDTTIYPNLGKSVYVYSGWYDEKLLPPTREIMALKHSKKLFILHEIGSHWYYNSHVPEQNWYFTPVTTNRIVANNTIEQIVNSYDNTIRYTDQVLDSLVTLFSCRKAIIFYLSDHGESLGENGSFFHAGDAEPMHSCGAVVWYSDLYKESYPEKIAALESNKNNAYLTDYLFHSVLSAAGLRVKDYKQSLDILTSCRNEEK